MKTKEPTLAPTPPAFKVGGAYSHYALFVLVLVYIFNFIDRHILSILSQEIQADLGATDAQMGFLYGTVFALFYAVFGIPLARFADVWSRRNLISIGLFFWSLMTALSGTARTYGVLATYRIGVGIGEASASPAAYSLLSDYYSPRRRATVLSIYSSGAYIGSGIGLFLGGYLLQTWNGWYPDPSLAPFQLRGWQVALFAVGAPGLLMALWVRTLREPQRGISEGLVATKHPAPYSVLKSELAAILPLSNLYTLKRAGASLRANFLAAVVIGAMAVALVKLNGNSAQWVALGISVYIAFSWAQNLLANDPATFHLILGTKGMMYMTVGFTTMAFVIVGVGYWTAPLLLRLHDTNPAEVGLYMGLGSALGGLIGITLGGMVGDWAKQKHAGGRMLVGVASILSSVPMVLWMINAGSLAEAFIANFFVYLTMTAYGGIPSATAMDLVLPRMRAIAGAFLLLITNIFGFALGPFSFGLLSDIYGSGGMNSAESLRSAITSGLLVYAIPLILFLLAWRQLPNDETSKVERARAHGEEV